MKKIQTQLLITIIFQGLQINLSADTKQFQELMEEIKYATGLVGKKKYNLGQYYDHMADFFEYANMPTDADGLRILAVKWKKEKGESNDA